MTKVKICGITNLEDALLSAKLGADALGFNFHEKSPRYIAPEKAGDIIDQLPERVLIVGVFVNERLDNIVEIAHKAGLNAIQLHGEEPPEFAAELKITTGLEVIKAFRVSKEFDANSIRKYDVDAILLDAFSPNEHGGTGKTFDWDIARMIDAKLYLAGGLSTENVADAIKALRPYAVDACSCLESSKGVKNRDKLKQFIANAKEND